MKRTVLGTAAVATIAAATLAIARLPALTDLDRRVYDALARTSPPADQAAPVVIVAVDEASLQSLGQWPWPREIVATLVTRLQAAGAAAIAFDVLFAEPERSGPSGLPTSDDTLAEAMANGPTVASYAFMFGTSGGVPNCTLHPVALLQRHPADDDAPASRLPRASGVVCTLGSLTAAAGASGHLNAVTDADGLLRRVPLLIAFEDQVYPSLALAAARLAVPGAPLMLDARGDGQLALVVDGRTIDLDDQGRMLLRYSSVRTTTVSAADVIHGRVANDVVRGRVVLVGATAVGLDDVVATPLHRLPGVEVHATVAASLLGGIVNHRPGYSTLLELALTIGCALVVVLLGHRFGLRASAAGAAILLLIMWAASRAFLHRSGAYVSPLYPALAVAIGMIAAGVAGVARERRRADRERTRRGDAQRLIVQALTTLTETRDTETGQHARRTQEYTHLLATTLARRSAYRDHLTEDQISLISTLAPLHDIGKVGVSDAVLRKPGALTKAEVTEMRRHPGLGHESLLKAEALAGVHDDEVLKVAKEIVHTHHEFWDGSGYPSGLRGTEIPLSGRIVALVDVYDAMVAERAYRKAMTHREAVDAIVAARGLHFDPEVVDAFLTVEAEFARIAGQYAAPAPSS